MTELLKTELQRIGDTAPDVRVPAPDLWRRGRRARLRDRLLTTGAVIAVLALLGGAAWISLGGPDRPPPTDDSSAPGVPGTIWGIPSRVEWDRTSTDVTTGVGSGWTPVGVAAAAYLSDSGQPVVITAHDGAYHVLDDLPDLQPLQAAADVALGEHGWMSLSPDGSRLAYAWANPAIRDTGAPMPTGINVVDLVTGDIRRNSVLGGEGVAHIGLTWSPDGTWVGYVGSRTTSWQQSRRAYRGTVVGRVRALTHTTSQRDWTGPVAGLAIGNDGSLLVSNGSGRLSTWSGSTVSRQPIDDPAEPNLGAIAVLSSQGTRLVWETTSRTHQLTYLDIATGRVHQVPLDKERYPFGTPVRPLGWVDDETVVVELTEYVSPSGYTGRQVALVSLDPASPSDEVLRVVGDEDPLDFSDHSQINFMTVATTLMTADRPTVARPEPDWPMTTDQRLVLWTIGAGVPLLMLLFWWRWRRLWRLL